MTTLVLSTELLQYPGNMALKLQQMIKLDMIFNAS